MATPSDGETLMIRNNSTTPKRWMRPHKFTILTVRNVSVTICKEKETTQHQLKEIPADT